MPDPFWTEAGGRVDHVLLIGFGGPEQPQEVMPFLKEVTRGLALPEERLQVVAGHYARTGGASPYNAHAFRLRSRLEERLREEGPALPVAVGMRNWHPFLEDVLAELSRAGRRAGLGVVLAPHRSEASFDRYVRSLEEARTRTGGMAPYRILGPWHDAPFFIRAQAEEAGKIMGNLSPAERRATALLFTAHSIPAGMAAVSRYEEEIRASCARIAQALGVPEWTLGFQSRSGPPTQPWAEPDVLTVIRRLKKGRRRTVLLVPVGFLFDHTEVLYDLDVEARAAAQDAGLRYLRASTAGSHPRFVAGLAARIKEELAR